MSTNRKAKNSRSRPRVTVVVPVEPQGDPGLCIKALHEFVPSGLGIEVLISRGSNPSLQRNRAVEVARGDFVYFVDSDAMICPQTLDLLLKSLENEGYACAGGPNLAPNHQNTVQKAISHVLGSFLGSASSRARYGSVGDDRDSNEKELILCNLMVRRDAFIESGGFREDLYPNEENEFLNRLTDLGWKFRYIPSAVVKRPRRETIAAFALQGFRYGRGRIQQIKANPHAGDLVQLVPLVALLTCLGLLFSPWAQWAFWLVEAFMLVALWEALRLGLKGQLSEALLVIVLYPLRHFSYALGLASGFLFSTKDARNNTCEIEKVTLKPGRQS